MSAIGQTMPAAVATRATSALRALEEAPMGDKAAVREDSLRCQSGGDFARGRFFHRDFVPPRNPVPTQDRGNIIGSPAVVERGQRRLHASSSVGVLGVRAAFQVRVA